MCKFLGRKTALFGPKKCTFVLQGEPILHNAGLTSCRSYPLLLSLITLQLRYALQYYSFVGKGVKRGKRRLLFNSKYFYLHILIFFKPHCG